MGAWQDRIKEVTSNNRSFFTRIDLWLNLNIPKLIEKKSSDEDGLFSKIQAKKTLHKEGFLMKCKELSSSF